MQGKRFAFVYGSQTGTAKRFAQSTAREARNRYGVTSVVCSIDEYDWDDLGDFTADSIVCFFMATYGEGEPTDSAIAFTQRLLDKSIVFSNGATSIPAFRYVMFGCGNRSYDQFNQAAIDIDRRLMELGATRVGHVGLGDHDKSIDDDYERWVMVLWPELSTVAGLVEGHEAPTGMYVIKETTHLDQMGEGVHHGDLSDEAPFLAPVISTRSLMSPTADRTCVHLELGLEGSGMSYSAGDHVGIWPSNPDREVDRILGILGLNKESAIQVTSIDPESFQVPFPSPATYLAIFRHYLDICSPPSHSVLSLVATFAPSPAAVERMRSIATSMSEAGLTLGETLCLASGATVDGKGRMDSDAGLETWRIPMDTIITILPRLQPRYYSISSSPRLYPSSAHLTAVTLKYQNALPASGDARWVHGVGSNFLLQIQRSAQSQVPGDDSPTYTLDGPNGTHRVNNALHIPIRIRQSKFRLPASSRIPIIMIGPGTGVAPFRGFVQERVAMARDVKKRGGSIATWAPILLFCGARRRDEEWLYSEEWTEYAAELNGKLQVHCAFSRETDSELIAIWRG